tara:strand:- start:19692 stop:21410 length:1719 start_codon:yes stop_codon:yes gene_type:complete
MGIYITDKCKGKLVKLNLILTLLVFHAYAHQGFAPPVDSTNSGGRSHSGFGNLGGNDYEASVKLRKTCLGTDLARYRSEIQMTCAPEGEENTFELTEFLDTGASLMTRNKLQAYAASVIASNVNLINGTSGGANPNTCNGIPTPTPPPHETVRESSLSVENAVSAAYIDRMLTPNGASDDYEIRIRRNYPYLKVPNDSGSRRILRKVEERLGNAYQDDGNMFAHSVTMAALDAEMTNNAISRTEISDIVEEVQAEYGQYLESQLPRICNMSIEDISERFPEIFDQFLIDLPEEESSISRYALCKESFYYNPESFDSDCDGVKDADDANPGDPFSPRAVFNIAGKNYINPPFTINGSKTLERVNNEIRVKRDINIDVSGLSEADRERVLANIGACRDEVKQTVEDAFIDYLGTNRNLVQYNLNFDLNLNPVTSGRSDFNIHRCWCSTCEVYYNHPTRGRIEIPRDTCRADFTKEMEEGLNDPNLNPVADRRSWFNQEDAANLTIGSSSDCKTIKHELLHKVGLSDEYVASYYPFNLVGEHDSLMNNGERLYPRHIGDLLSPWKCSMNNGNYGL